MRKQAMISTHIPADDGMQAQMDAVMSLGLKIYREFSREEMLDWVQRVAPELITWSCPLNQVSHYLSRSAVIDRFEGKWALIDPGI